MFSFSFMRYAFAVGCLLALSLPLLGQNIVLKKVSLTGEALSHTSIAGVALGLIAGWSNPLYGAIIFSIVGAVLIELARKRFKKYSDLAIVVILSFAIALAAILSQYSNSGSFSSYLFGSLLLNDWPDLLLVGGVFLLVAFYVAINYKKLMYVAYNEEDAKLSGIHVGFLNFSHTILTALVISVCAKTIGALLVSALLIIPVAAGMLIAKNYKQMTLFSLIISLLSVIIGLTTAYYANLQSGGCIVLASIALLLCSLAYKPISKKIEQTKNKKKIAEK